MKGSSVVLSDTHESRGLASSFITVINVSLVYRGPRRLLLGSARKGTV